ncbi:MAG: DUF3592 domain-containing protein [Gammaproteobacteria bacterium]|nr:DUF3592 domain-containing protein [Gammaproteobacteria bacterium]
MMFINADEIFSLIILLVALYLFFKAVRYNWRRWRFYDRCEVTKAQVIQKDLKELSDEDSIFEKKSLRFVNSVGQVIVYETRWVGKSDPTQALHSDGIEIIYDPENPSDIQLNNLLRIWFWPLILLALAFIFFMSTLHESIDNGALDKMMSPIIRSVKTNTVIEYKDTYLKQI